MCWQCCPLSVPFPPHANGTVLGLSPAKACGGVVLLLPAAIKNILYKNHIGDIYAVRVFHMRRPYIATTRKHISGSMKLALTAGMPNTVPISIIDA